jgi:O-antigen/teichoic acid export membrane protein
MKAKGAIFLSISSIIFMISGYVTNVWLGRYFGPHTYGTYGVLITLMTALNVMQINGLPQSTSKFIAEKSSSANEILKSSLQLQLLLTFCITIIFYFSSSFFANVFNENSLAHYIKLFSLIFPFYGLFTVYVGYYNGLHDFKKQAQINSIYSLSKLLLIVALTIKFGITGAIVGFILSPIIALGFSFVPPKGKGHFPYALLINYSFPLIIFGILSTLQLSIDLFSLKALEENEKIAGFYTAAQSIAIIPFFMMSSIGQVLFPSISKFTGSGNIKEASRIISKSLRYLLIILLPIASIMIVTASDLVEILFGKKYLPAVEPLQILLVSYMFLTFFATIANILNSSRHSRFSMIAAGTGLGLTLILCLVLIPDRGMKGAAIASLVGALSSSILATIKAYKIFNFQLSFMSILKIIAGSAVIFGVGLLIKPPLLTLPIFYVFLGSLYVAIIHILGEVTLEDRAHIKNLLPPWFPLTRWL